MAPPLRLSAALALRARESARRRHSRDLKVESLEPRLAMATGLLSTLVSVRDESGQKLLAPGVTSEIAEGQELAASVRLTRKPDSAILVSLKSLAPLEVGAPPTTLRFTKANWDQPQTISLRALEDGSRDGDNLVPVKLTTSVARNPQSKATSKLWVESLDSGTVAPATPITAMHRGTVTGGGNSGTVTGGFDAEANRGTASFRLTMPQVRNIRDRVVTLHYSVGADNRVQVEAVEGIKASKIRLDATYREFGNDRGIFGTLTVMQPHLGQSATATVTAAAVPEAVQNLAATPTGVGSLLLSWNPPADGATGYTVTMTATTSSIVNGAPSTTSTTTTSTTTATSMPFTGLSSNAFYAFSVVATTAAGPGAAATAGFGKQTVDVGKTPLYYAKALDGSIWVANANATASTVQQLVNRNGIWTAQPAIEVKAGIIALAIAPDGSIWVGNGYTNTIQQIVHRDGAWSVQPAIDVVSSPRFMTFGLDGAVWLSPLESTTGPVNCVQQVVQVDGVWTAQAPIPVQEPTGITTGLDGSIWVANFLEDGSVQQIVNDQGVWTAQPPISLGTGASYPYAMTTGLDGSIWVSAGQKAGSSVQQIVKTDGGWVPRPAISTDWDITALTLGPDGSLWASCYGNGVPLNPSTVQQIVNENGVWTPQPGTSVPYLPTDVVVADDGSLFVAMPFYKGPAHQHGGGGFSFPFGFGFRIPSIVTAKSVPYTTVQEVVAAPGTPYDLKATFGPGPGQMTAAWSPAPANGSPIVSYTVTASQGATTHTVTTSGTSCTFSGLTLGQDATYFTVTATNFAGTSPSAGLLIGPDGNPIPTANAGIGIVTDGTPFTGGGFDGNGNAYSWQALGSSPTLAWNGVTLDLGNPNQPDFTFANGQTIPVTQGDSTTLNLAGAAVNGSQTNQQITLTFTDGSTVTWTQSFSDWGSPQNYGHEAIISKQSYRNTASGGSTQTSTNVYGYSYTIPAGKTLKSITLPNTNNVRILDIQMSTATSVDLSSAYTSWGIANGSTQVANNKGFDGGGYYYYSAQLGPLVAWSGATFNFGPVPTSSKGANNFVQAKGQSIDLPQADYGWLYLAGAGANGGQQNQKLTLTFTDNSTATWTQSFSDWCSPSGYAGETIIQQQSSRVNQVGNVHSQTNYVYGYAYQIPAGKTLKSIALPNNTNNLGILGIALM